MKKCVKIIKCSDTKMWYRDLVGQCYEMLFIDEYDNKVVVDMANSRGNLGSVYQDDVEFYEVEDDVVIREFEKILTEAEKNSLSNLEDLASSIRNEVIQTLKDSGYLIKGGENNG